VPDIACVRPSELIHSTSFRLGLLHASTFAISVTVLFLVVYWTTDLALRRQLDRDIEAEASGLVSQVRNQGIDGLEQILGQRAEARPDAYYLLQDRLGRRLAGNFPERPAGPGWIDAYRTFDRDDNVPRDRAHLIRAMGVPVPDGGMLLVGRDTYPLNELREVIVRGFGICLSFTVVLAMGSSLLMSTSVLRRIAAITRATREIMGGEIARRLPTSGGGDEFDGLAARLNEMLDRIQALMENLRQVSNEIAHDLRTPLTRLRQRLELGLSRAHAGEDQALALARAIEDVDAILRTFTSLLRIAQIEAGTRRAGFTTVDLSGLTGDLLDVYIPVAADNGQSLEAHIAPDVRVLGDRELLTQMLANLIENALQHTPEGTRVELCLRVTDRDPVLILADDGPGIPIVMHEQVFERFTRLDVSRTATGSGLGLSLVAAIAELHGSSVELSDNQPGLQVTLRFPVQELRPEERWSRCGRAARRRPCQRRALDPRSGCDRAPSS
jgi:signal transduction histidine kinase